MLDTVDPQEARYARMRWNTPLSTKHADLLLDRLDLRPGQRIADLGCGWGELLLTAVARSGAGATGVGVDKDAPLLARGRAAAARRGLDANAGHPRAAEIREWLDTRERQYVGVYRGLLGFAYLVLAR